MVSRLCGGQSRRDVRQIGTEEEVEGKAERPGRPLRCRIGGSAPLTKPLSRSTLRVHRGKDDRPKASSMGSKRLCCFRCNHVYTDRTMQ